MASNYYTVMEDFGQKSVTDITTDNYYPLGNVWRNDPLSIKSWIKPNIAGYYPFPSFKTSSQSIPKVDWEFDYYNVCSTRYPSNPQYKEHKTIILYR